LFHLLFLERSVHESTKFRGDRVRDQLEEISNTLRDGLEKFGIYRRSCTIFYYLRMLLEQFFAFLERILFVAEFIFI